MEMGWASLHIWMGSINRCWECLADRGAIIKVLRTRHPDSPALELASVSHTKESGTGMLNGGPSGMAETRVIVEWTRQVWLPRVVDKYSLHASVVARLWLGRQYGVKEYVQ
ncbi:hypothetical protein IW261DRAFT_1424763 [Armillaria novae-zelandiae]|uniref:Uncharacterized protein n=1 Tax=Armillaria novae-zelandiae TaxID=153914 RepID=A0AA39NUR9_9AGAR|nr:hypothetical protein IW261DRAFT_1424763 [Armillaria novae-zelandiae]